jgi:hypothetical protein
MNENIRRLLAQAYLEQADIRDTTKIAEKFAQLIVGECIDYCGENLSKTVGGALKIHFGVDE